jgi:hypothetical protein
MDGQLESSQAACDRMNPAVVRDSTRQSLAEFLSDQESIAGHAWQKARILTRDILLRYSLSLAHGLCVAGDPQTCSEGHCL